MRKLILSSAVALLTLSGAAMADGLGFPGIPGGPTNGTVSNKFDFTKTTTRTHETTRVRAFDQYNGFQGFTSAEHGGAVETKTNGQGIAGGVSLNYSKANFTGGEVNLNGQIGGGINSPVLNGSGSIAGNVGVRGLAASSESVSGSLAVAGSMGPGSSSVITGGYAAGGAGARNESGYSNTSYYNHTDTRSTNWNGSGSYTRAQ